MEVSVYLGLENYKILKGGSVTWKAPSNIALVKYWGKTDPQIPKNTSVSFTLSNCFTQTTLYFEPVTETNNFQFECYFEGERKESFEPKIATFLERIAAYTPYLKQYILKIETFNSFPHSSGIASSASGMAALALCFMSIEKALVPSISETYFYEKASFLARLGSGSACRSLYKELVLWGKHQHISQSSDLYGAPFGMPVHAVFTTYQDTILLVDKGEKQVSSTVGHGLMENHPFANQRFVQAQENITKISQLLASGDVDAFMALVESEALTLHAMMMTSNPYFILMKPNTLEIINQIWLFRHQTGVKVCFTLDAGANVHLLYPNESKTVVHKFIQENLSVYCKNGEYIHDQVGNGPELVAENL